MLRSFFISYFFYKLYKLRKEIYMSQNSKPTAVPPHEPPKNPNWPSRTGNPSGNNRGNAAPNSGKK